MSWNGSWTWGNWVAMSLMMIVFWALIAAAAAMFRALRKPRPTQPEVDLPQILDQRLARGEITGEEYSHRREMLRASPNSG